MNKEQSTVKLCTPIEFLRRERESQAPQEFKQFVAELAQTGRVVYQDEIAQRSSKDVAHIERRAESLGLASGVCATYDFREVKLILGEALVCRERVCEFMDIHPDSHYDSDFLGEDIKFGLDVRTRYQIVGGLHETEVELGSILKRLDSYGTGSGYVYRVRLLSAYKQGLLD